MTREELQAIAYNDLKVMATEAGLAPQPNIKKEDLITLILGSLSVIQADGSTIEKTTGVVPEPAPTVTLSMSQFNALVARMEALEKGAKTEQLATSSDANVDRLIQAFAKSTRKDTDEHGFAFAESIGPEDLLPEPVTFWTRTPQYHIRSLRIGPVPERLPRGHKLLPFRRVFGPVLVADPTSPIPRTMCMCQFTTSDKVLVEKLRQDVRYGDTFFDDVADAARLEHHTDVYRRLYEGHKVTIRANADPSHVLRLAKQEGLSFGANTAPERLLHLVAQKYALRDSETELAGMQQMVKETQRQMSLAKADGVAMPQ